MKTRNQVLLAGIKFLVNTVFVALLGVGAGTIAKNQEPFRAQVCEAFVSQPEVRVQDILKESGAPLESLKTIIINTQAVEIKKFFCIRNESAMNEDNWTKEGDRQIKMPVTTSNVPKVTNQRLKEQPRSDWIYPNTS